VFKHILIPLDGSEHSERAVEPALSLAEQYGARITLLTVILQFPASRLHVPMLDQRADHDGHQYLEEVQIMKMGAASVPVDIVTKYGAPAESIAEFALDSQVDLIVMSTYGTSSTTGMRYALGSTAWKLLQDAPCPLLLITVPRPFASDVADRERSIPTVADDLSQERC
jgi:nucleotide-binding universal stress UspA family protein